MGQNYLFYIAHNYSFEILRPLQKVLRERGDNCAWFVEGDEINLQNFSASEQQIKSVKDVMSYNPVAVFVPGNLVPDFFPGLKVQVFHGLEYKKKGHFQIRDCFDLYCTQGELTTNRFNQLALQHQNFQVVETGWSKLDPLFKCDPYPLETDLPVVLFAPTFSPKLTCALTCFEEIKRLVNKKDRYWLVKFHPKMNPEWIALYQQIKSNNFQIIDKDTALPLLKRADIMLSDTSSMVGEFLLLNKPVVTINNAAPGDYLININESNQLETALEKALTATPSLLAAISEYREKLHPYFDGRSAERILQAVVQANKSENTPAKKLPNNWFRNLKLRKRLGYWKL